MATIKIVFTDKETTEKEVELKELTVLEFSRVAYALVQSLCRILKSEGVL